MLGELFQGSTTKWGLKRFLPGMPDDFIDSIWDHYDHGTQRAILKLYRSAPPDVACTRGRAARRDQARRRSWSGAPMIRTCPTRFAHAYGEALGGETEVEVVDGAGHWPWIDRPELVERVCGIPELRPLAGLRPVLAAALVAALYLILDLRTGDLAAHLYRADLFAREGFTIWNGNWYGGHHTPAYSVLFPPLAHLLTPQVAGAIAAVAAAALFEPLARSQFGERAQLGRALVRGRGRRLALHGTAAVPVRRRRRAGRAARAAARPDADRRRPGRRVLARQPGRRALPRARRPCL